MVRHLPTSVTASKRQTEEKKQMKNKRLGLLSVLSFMVAISTMVPTAKADCVCACTFDCSDNSCYAEFSGNSASDCLKCVAGCCKAAQNATCHAGLGS